MMEEEEVVLERIASGGNEVDERARLNNQHWALRQHLLYHMLNYTLPPSAFTAGTGVRNVSTETTLLFPMVEEPEHPPIPEPGSPWLPRGGEGLLGGHGQRLRVARVGSKEGGPSGMVGVEWNGDGGVEIWDGKAWETVGNDTDRDRQVVRGARWVRNGVVVGVEGVLEMPPSIGESLLSSVQQLNDH